MHLKQIRLMHYVTSKMSRTMLPNSFYRKLGRNYNEKRKYFLKYISILVRKGKESYVKGKESGLEEKSVKS